MTDSKSEKERVLAQCAQLWGRVGLQGMTWEGISEASELDRAALARMFFSRDELVFQMLQREVGLLLEEAQSGLAEHSEVSGLIQQLAQDAVSFAERRPLLRALMLGRFDQWLPQWAERLHELRMRCLALPEALLGRAVEVKLVRADLPVEFAAQLMLELHVMDYANLARDERTRQRSGQRRKVALELVLRGLRHPSQPTDLTLAQVMGATGALLPPAQAPISAMAASDPMAQLMVRARQQGLAALGSLSVPAGFATQEEFLLSLIQRDVEAVVAQVRAVQRPGGKAMQMMREMSERAYLAVQAHSLVLTLINGDAQESLPGHQETLTALVQQMADTILPAVEAGVQQGLFRSDLPLELVARVLFELHMAGHLLHHQSGPGGAVRATQRRFAALDLVFRGILAAEE